MIICFSLSRRTFLFQSFNYSFLKLQYKVNLSIFIMVSTLQKNKEIDLINVNNYICNEFLSDTSWQISLNGRDQSW